MLVNFITAESSCRSCHQLQRSTLCPVLHFSHSLQSLRIGHRSSDARHAVARSIVQVGAVVYGQRQERTAPRPSCAGLIQHDVSILGSDTLRLHSGLKGVIYNTTGREVPHQLQQLLYAYGDAPTRLMPPHYGQLCRPGYLRVIYRARIFLLSQGLHSFDIFFALP